MYETKFKNIETINNWNAMASTWILRRESYLSKYGKTIEFNETNEKIESNWISILIFEKI